MQRLPTRMDASAIGWYGPLIDLSAASVHVGAYVQVVCFVHQFRSPEKLTNSKGKVLLKATLLVGDNTHPFFEVALWQNQVCANISAGDIILLQNVKITKFKDLIMATTVQQSSLSTMVQAHKLLLLDGITKTIGKDHMTTFLREKLEMVIKWAQLTQSTLLSFLDKLREQKDGARNSLEEDGKKSKTCLRSRKEQRHCSLIAEFASSREPCVVTFAGSIGEICLPSNIRISDLSSCLENWIFVSKGLLRQSELKIVEAFLSKGCKSCGLPMNEELSSLPLLCNSDTSNCHQIGWIYRPFLIHVWDHSAHIPVLVKNLAAQKIMGNISAETIFKSFEAFYLSTNENNMDTSTNLNGLRCIKGPCHRIIDSVNLNEDRKFLVNGQAVSGTSTTEEHLLGVNQETRTDFVKIFSVLLRTLLKKNSNSPFQFQVAMHPCEFQQSNNQYCLFELVSFNMEL